MPDRPLDIVFLGSGAFGLPTLQAVAQSHTITGIITQPDRRAGRGSKLTPTPIAAWAAEHLVDVPLLKPERINTAEDTAAARALKADAWVVIAFGQKLGKPLLTERFAINLHASLLPRWRGAAPINAAILAGDTTTGNSVITLADRMDAGLVLGQSTRAIEPHHTPADLHDLLASDGPTLVQRVLTEHINNQLAPVAQDDSLVTLASKLSRDDAWVDFTTPAADARNRIHGLNPWPGVTAQFRDAPLKLLRAEAIEHDHAEQPGTILDPAAGTIACGNRTALRLTEVQPAGKRPMPWADFARGRSPEAGEQLIGKTRSRKTNP